MEPERLVAMRIHRSSRQAGFLFMDILEDSSLEEIMVMGSYRNISSGFRNGKAYTLKDSGSSEVGILTWNELCGEVYSWP